MIISCNRWDAPYRAKIFHGENFDGEIERRMFLPSSSFDDDDNDDPVCDFNCGEQPSPHIWDNGFAWAYLYTAPLRAYPSRRGEGYITLNSNIQRTNPTLFVLWTKGKLWYNLYIFPLTLSSEMSFFLFYIIVSRTQLIIPLFFFSYPLNMFLLEYKHSDIFLHRSWINELILKCRIFLFLFFRIDCSNEHQLHLSWTLYVFTCVTDRRKPERYRHELGVHRIACPRSFVPSFEVDYTRTRTCLLH